MCTQKDSRINSSLLVNKMLGCQSQGGCKQQRFIFSEENRVRVVVTLSVSEDHRHTFLDLYAIPPLLLRNIFLSRLMKEIILIHGQSHIIICYQIFCHFPLFNLLQKDVALCYIKMEREEYNLYGLITGSFLLRKRGILTVFRERLRIQCLTKCDLVGEINIYIIYKKQFNEIL